MTQAEAISLAALVISGLIGALWLMLRERIKTLESLVAKIDELKVLVARMEERERRKATPEGGGFRVGREPEKR